MIRSPWMLAIGLLLATACSEKGTSLVLVAVEADPSVSALAKVEVIVSKGVAKVASKTFDWVPGSVNRYGVYVSKDVTGQVTITVNGLDGSGMPIAVNRGGGVQVTVASGETSAEVTIQLIPGPPIGPDGGAGGTGGAGGAGSGTGGAGTGTGGASTGTGGAAGGTTGTGGASTGSGGGAGGLGGARSGGAGGGGTAGAGGSGPGWRGAKVVEADVLVANWTPAVAVDAMGNAVLVYRHGTGIRASRYNAATDTWGAPVGVETRTGGQAYSPQIAVDKNGQWLVIWQQDESMSLRGLWFSTSTDGATWAAPVAITTASASLPSLAMNKDGAAVAAWYGRDSGSGPFPCTASVRVGGTWTTPTIMKPASTANGFPQQAVAMSGTGEAYVVWQDTGEGTAGQYSIWMRRYAAGAWAPATLVESYDAGGADTQSVAANASGQVIIAWRQTGATVDEMWARRYTTGGVATAPVLLGQGDWIAWDPLSSATIDDNGVATVAWSFEVQKKFNAYVSRAAHTAAFPASPTAIETDNQAAAVNNSLEEEAKIYAVLGSDGPGNVVIVWRKRTGTRFDLWSRRLSNGVWGTASLIEDQNDASVPYPVLSVGSNGTAVAAWYYQGDNRIWANVLR